MRTPYTVARPQQPDQTFPQITSVGRLLVDLAKGRDLMLEHRDAVRSRGPSGPCVRVTAVPSAGKPERLACVFQPGHADLRGRLALAIAIAQDEDTAMQRRVA